jgi:hypothetical protein
MSSNAIYQLKPTAMVFWHKHYGIPWAEYTKCARFYGEAEKLGVEATAVRDLSLGRKGGLIMFFASGRAEYMMTLDRGEISLAVKDGLHGDRWRGIYEGAAAPTKDWDTMIGHMRKLEGK